jgi:hypothetical protein
MDYLKVFRKCNNRYSVSKGFIYNNIVFCINFVQNHSKNEIEIKNSSNFSMTIHIWIYQRLDVKFDAKVTKCRNISTNTNETNVIGII